ncbi:pentatricopeptide repeat-containing protein At3g18970 isoform X2 [Magnolia sinica]|uniref:pentatricopeptide repeat-containing protein At3g18970 isoform X2 n=1 Tax=Magnolia sinica TaxID=86752 RepID=UPI002657BC0B|nr:pentatricopeptide repeat-containing protein At3g18970 isoform X2 [Magnolia sinica]XP_058080255.1 pentatricopeptide repeat-containing protein At3g18970 isoform X2 [Magnolia sinica]XP_058080256.1 pentatricopeptide repeat-containing protein At3g18970 isoform X2 [Magnolia sinica]XP_058080257.1 pentatricopeptide repeat-containing protein At3g18970 isoform X2 [Magnolia sinica]XP_058080258.1 pentatricopeptide repeat-containing protein At3g18970 isoform X2 [Magnolia sinica]
MALLPRARCLCLLLWGQGHWTGIRQLTQIHAQMIVNGLCHALPLSNLVKFYSTVLALDDVHLLYRQVEDHSMKRFIWNIMIRHTRPKEAILLYANRGRDAMFLAPDKFTFIFILNACAHSSALWEGKQIHAQILKTIFASDVAVQTTCVHFYARCRAIDSAHQLFDKIPFKSSVSWNVIISGYSSQGRRPIGYARKALVLFRAMLLESRPTDTTMVGLVSACSHLGVLAAGSCMHGYIHKTIPLPEEHLFIGTALVDMYSKCGCLTSALQVFERMKERNALTWTAMITGFAIHGQGKEALELLDAMEVDNIVPNAATFTCLLSACCHTGLVEEGLHLFNSMSSRFGIKPCIQHYGCIVDLLGRAGLLEEAYKFIRHMPLKPDVILWRTLLSACKLHRNVVLGEKVGKLLLQLEHGSSDASEKKTPTSEDYIALSNIYALAERWEDVGALRGVMKVKGIQNEPGYSCIQVDKRVCEFIVNMN